MALLLAAATLFFSDVLFAGSNFYYRDLFLYHFPMKSVVREAMLSGEFPLWNRFYSGGQPLAANPAYELFYPMQWIILIGTFPFGFALHIVAHVWVALAGMYLLLRQMRLGVPAAVFGALSFGMGGLLLGSMTTLPTFFVWATAPLVGWGVLRLLDQLTARRFAAASLLVGAQLLIGEPIATLQVWILIGAGSLLYVRFSGVSARRVIAALALVATCAMAVASVQLLPGIDHARASIRARGIPFATVRQYSMPPARPLEMVVPHLFGRLDPNVRSFWGSAAFDRQSPYLHSLYCGIGVAILVMAGLLARSPGSGTTVFLAIISFVFAVGDRTPLLRILYDWNIARGIRYPEKFAALGLAAMIVFAATIVDRLLNGEEKIRRACTIAGGLVTLAAAGPLLWSLSPHFAQSFQAFWGLPGRRAADMAATARQAWIIGFVVNAAAALLLIVFRRVKRRSWMIASLALVVLDLFMLANDIVARMPGRFFTEPEIVRRLDPHHEGYALFNRAPWQPYTADYQRYSAVSSAWFARNALVPFTTALWGLRSNLEVDYDETDLLPTHDLLNAMMRLGNSGFAQWGEAFAAISNVGYVVDLRPFDHVLVESGGDLAMANPVRFTRMPAPHRYYFPRTIVRTASTDEVLASMRRRIPVSTAFVAFDAPSPPLATVLNVRESSNATVLDVQTAAPALLVATVTRHKYWSAAVDGRPAAILPANIAYQSLVVPAGRHRIELRYWNPLVVAGGVVSSLAVLLCVGLTIPRPRPRRLRSGSGNRSYPQSRS